MSMEIFDLEKCLVRYMNDKHYVTKQGFDLEEYVYECENDYLFESLYSEALERLPFSYDDFEDDESYQDAVDEALTNYAHNYIYSDHFEVMDLIIFIKDNGGMTVIRNMLDGLIEGMGDNAIKIEDEDLVMRDSFDAVSYDDSYDSYVFHYGPVEVFSTFGGRKLLRNDEDIEVYFDGDGILRYEDSHQVVCKKDYAPTQAEEELFSREEWDSIGI